MQRRAEFQDGVVLDFDSLARGRTDPKYRPSEPVDATYGDTQYNTFMQPKDRVIWQWRNFTEHGIMPRAGGLDDQPPEWKHDMHLADRLYAYRAWLIRREVDDRKP